MANSLGQRTAWDGPFLVLGLAALLPACLVFLRLILQSKICAAAVAVWKCMKMSLRPWRVDANDSVKHLVEGNMLRQKAHQFQKLCVVMCVVVAPSTGMMVSDIATGSLSYTTDAQRMTLIWHQLLFGVVALRPSVVTDKNVDWLYTVLVQGQSITITPWTCHPRLLGPTVFLCTCFVLLLSSIRRSVSSQRLPLLVLNNLAFALCASSTVFAHGQNCICFVTTHYLSAALVAVVMVWTYASHLVEQGFRTANVWEFQLQEAQELRSAASALLRSCCEVVLDLDDHATILSPGPELSSFLLKNSGAVMQGTSLADLITEDGGCRAEFIRRLSAPKLQDIGLAESMPVEMRDGDGTPLHLEFLWVQFQNIERRTRFLLGIREISEQEATSTLDPPVPLVSPQQLASARRPSKEGHFTLPETASVSSGSLEDAAAIAVIDTAEVGYPIAGLTDEFCVRIGRLPVGTSLSRTVERPAQFDAWMDKNLECQATGGLRPADLKVKLKMPQGVMKARCRIVETPQPMVRDDNQECAPVGLLFYAIRPASNSVPRTAPALRGTPRNCRLRLSL